MVYNDNEKLPAEVMVDEIDKHPWTIVDSAMKIVRCKSCESELVGGPIDYPDC